MTVVAVVSDRVLSFAVKSLHYHPVAGDAALAMPECSLWHCQSPELAWSNLTSFCWPSACVQLSPLLLSPPLALPLHCAALEGPAQHIFC